MRYKQWDYKHKSYSIKLILLYFLIGIWSRDIRYKSNLPLTEINKILKNLESKKLIKAVKSVAVSSFLFSSKCLLYILLQLYFMILLFFKLFCDLKQLIKKRFFKI